MAAPTPSLPPLGHLVRMRPLKPSEVPAHPALASLQTSASLPPLAYFLATALDEGREFVAQYLPQTFKVKTPKKSVPPSAAPVELLEHEISAHDLPEEGRTMGQPENWFARISVHENAAREGTASWEEFDAGLRVNHSENEKEYTPDLLEAHKVLDWKEQLAAISGQVGEWQEADAAIFEMVHKIPFPLTNRVFNVLVISGKKGDEFVDVQIPIDPSKIAEAKYKSDPKITTGVYCSVERGELIENRAKVRWQMATASDARGILPIWAQKMAVPGAIAKDVALFVDWSARKRKQASA